METALAFFVGKLDFELRADTALGNGKRWVLVAPHGAAGGLLLAGAVGDRQRNAIGDQSGGRVFLFLKMDVFACDHLAYTQLGIRSVEPPRLEPYGIVAVFEDLYGNGWNLIEHITIKGRSHSSMLFLGKLAGQPAGLRLSTSSAANMNEWQKVGSRKGSANDRMWVS